MLPLDSSGVVGKSKLKRAVIFLILLVSIFSLQFASSSANSTNATSGSSEVGKTATTLDELKDYPSLDTAKLPMIYAGSYALIDSKTGEYVLGKNANNQVSVASTTKMTTALVAREVYKLDDVLTVKSGPYISGSKADLYVGEKITVENLLKALLIQSGNDAAITLSEGLSTESGDTTAYVQKMNAFLVSHNIKHTNFVDPAGLNDTGKSTAADLGQIARLVLNDSILSEIVKTAETTIVSNDGRYTHQLKNSNRLVLGDSEYYLPGSLGIKTGFTYDAGHCLISAYTINGRVLVAAILNTNESSITASAAESYKLWRWTELHLKYSAY